MEKSDNWVYRTVWNLWLCELDPREYKSLADVGAQCTLKGDPNTWMCWKQSTEKAKQSLLFTWRGGRSHCNCLLQGGNTVPSFWLIMACPGTGWSFRAFVVRNLLCTTRWPHFEWDWAVNDAWCILFDVNCCWAWRWWYRIRAGECRVELNLLVYSIPRWHHATSTCRLEPSITGLEVQIVMRGCLVSVPASHFSVFSVR